MGKFLPYADRETNTAGAIISVDDIDDRQENVDAAQRLGIYTILFRSAAQVRTALKGLGVLDK